ncbi:MAG TPA: hypothetical protein VHB72_01250 [Candidatus Saccharimonadales bacterium]|nr:hypothetical protein [Candidatus Saccharimonadales bacterium]
MKKSIERAASVIAVTAALAAGSAKANAETAPAPLPGQAHAEKVAKKISNELYDRKDFPKGVPVPGILNGSVKINFETVGSAEYENPVILSESHSAAATEKNSKLINGSWIGIPTADAEGHVAITPVQVHVGEHNRETTSLHLLDPTHTVLEGAGVYAVPAQNGPDQLWGFDIQNGDSGKFQITADGMK